MASYVQFPGSGAQPPAFLPYGTTGGYPPSQAQQGMPNQAGRGGMAPPGMVPIQLEDGTTAFLPANQAGGGGGGGGWPGVAGPMISPAGSGSSNGMMQQQMTGFSVQQPYGDVYEHTDTKIKRSSKGAKKAKEWEKEQRAREEAEEKFRQQEILNQQGTGRRMSVGAGLHPAQSIGDLNRRFNNMAMASNTATLQPQATGGAFTRQRGLSVTEVDRDNQMLGVQNPYGSVRSRRVSVSAGGGAEEFNAAKARSRKLSAAAQNPYGTPGQALTNFYDDQATGAAGFPTGKSPYARPGSLPPGAWVGPDGRMMVQNPALTGGSHNGLPLAPQITGGGAFGASPRSSSGRVIVPSAFYREVDRLQNFTRFAPFPIVWDLNELKQFRPPLPALLVPNDVRHDEWEKAMNDVAQAWSGLFNYNLWKLGATSTGDSRNSAGRGHLRTGSRIPTMRPSTAVARTVDIWNISFFHRRGLEIVVYRGLERRTGDTAGARVERMNLDQVPTQYQALIAGKKKRRPPVTPLGQRRRVGQVETDSEDSETTSLTSSSESSESSSDSEEDDDDDEEEDVRNPYGGKYKGTVGGTTSRRTSMAADPYDRWVTKTKLGWKMIEKGQKLQRKKRKHERRQRRQRMRDEPLYSLWISCRDAR